MRSPWVNTPAFALSLDPGIGGVFVGSGSVAAGYLQVDAPLLIDVAFGSRVRLALAPKYTGIFAFSTDEDSTSGAGIHLLGGTVGVEIAIGRMFRLMPFGGVMGWLNIPEGAEGVEALWFTGGIASQWIF